MDPIPSESSSAAVTRDDAQELASFGYTQQLRRTMGSFSSFAVAFSLISVITGVTANFGHGLQLVGGGVLSSWLI
ncbi:MAG: amino acid permease, partial [Limisphaerales bacterium]